MDIRKTVEKAMAKPMDRREFLAHAGAIALAVVGVTTVLKSLGLHRDARSGNGYGGSPYGGNQERR